MGLRRNIRATGLRRRKKISSINKLGMGVLKNRLSLKWEGINCSKRPLLNQLSRLNLNLLPRYSSRLPFRVMLQLPRLKCHSKP